MHCNLCLFWGSINSVPSCPVQKSHCLCLCLHHCLFDYILNILTSRYLVAKSPVLPHPPELLVSCAVPHQQDHHKHRQALAHHCSGWTKTKSGRKNMKLRACPNAHLNERMPQPPDGDWRRRPIAVIPLAPMVGYKCQRCQLHGCSLVRFPNCIVYQSRGWGPWLDANFTDAAQQNLASCPNCVCRIVEVEERTDGLTEWNPKK